MLAGSKLVRYVALAGLASAVAACVCVYGTGCLKGPPNVVFIVIDSLRADHVGCYNYPRRTTPNLDALAGESILFRNAISAAPWTVPSVASMLTSRYPSELGIRERPVVVGGSPEFLAEIMGRHGYRTHGIVSHDNVSARLGFGQGFETFNEDCVLGHGGISSPGVTRRAMACIDAKDRRPFFLFLHYFDPHYNYILYPKADYDPQYKGTVKSGEDIMSLWKKMANMSADDIGHVQALYDSEIFRTDEALGILFEYMKASGVYDNTIIVVTADHGEEFMERGRIGHCGSLYQELIHVPLLIKPPHGSGAVVEKVVGLIDVMPTILAGIGLGVPATCRGRPLPLADMASFQSRPVFSETFKANDQPWDETPIALRAVVMMDHIKVIYDQKQGTRTCYNLAHDKGEKHGFGAAEMPFSGMARVLDDWIESVATNRPHSSALPSLTPEQAQRLQSLGY